MSFFTSINELPPDPLFGLKARLSQDPRANKVDLGIGAYRDNDGKPWILPSVQKAQEILAADPAYNHEYLPIDGNAQFVSETLKVIFGDEITPKIKSRSVSAQTLSGTGALHFIGSFLAQFLNSSEKTVYLSDPTWANHKQIFSTLGFAVKSYPYWDSETKTLKIDEMVETISKAPSGSVILLHAVAHNPTGLDPTKSDWARILKAVHEKKHLPLFDIAYQGFASGSLAEDAYALREAVNVFSDIPMIICQSFAKNLGLYGERTGAAHLILPKDPEIRVASGQTSQKELLAAIKSQFKKITRSELSNPPAYGSKLAALVFSNPELRKQWEQDLVTMSSRIKSMRKALRDLLTDKYNTPGNWDHIVKQIGMFSFTGLSKDEVSRLEKEHGVYLTANGRASVAGLNTHNVDYVAKSIDEVVRFYSNKL